MRTNVTIAPAKDAICSTPPHQNSPRDPALSDNTNAQQSFVQLNKEVVSTYVITCQQTKNKRAIYEM